MAKIKQLSDYESQKIAAGQVVERPVNIVKELTENSLDAQASIISIYISDGGKEFIKICDNGCGMEKEDAFMSIKNHATSKIDKIEDIENINTFGFRGEALASISSVSKFKLKTRNLESDLATVIEVEGLNIISSFQEFSNVGTEVSVEDLFFNIPVRKKFLKTKDTELRQIVQLFQAFCLSRFDVDFKLYSEDRLLYNCPKTVNFKNRLSQIFQSDLSEKIINNNIKSDNYKISLEIYFTDPRYLRYDKNQIFIFVNKRWVKNYKLVQAIIKGYEGSLQPQKYPAAFLFITIDPALVDINVDPKKEEVKFLNPRVVEELICQAIKDGFINFNKKLIAPVNISSFISPLISASVAKKVPEVCFSKLNFEKINFENFSEPIKTETPKLIFEESLRKYNILGQLFSTYILLEKENSLVLVDVHAAHERIIYEKIKKDAEFSAITALVFPEIITLSQELLTLLFENKQIFDSLNLEIEKISENKILITAAPIYIKNSNLENIITEALSIISKESSKKDFQEKIMQEIFACIACKMAIKAGDKLTDFAMQNLISDLYKTENMYTCPHGRPTIWSLDKFDIEKKFKRDYKS